MRIIKREKPPSERGRFNSRQVVGPKNPAHEQLRGISHHRDLGSGDSSGSGSGSGPQCSFPRDQIPTLRRIRMADGRPEIPMLPVTDGDGRIGGARPLASGHPQHGPLSTRKVCCALRTRPARIRSPLKKWVISQLGEAGSCVPVGFLSRYPGNPNSLDLDLDLDLHPFKVQFMKNPPLLKSPMPGSFPQSTWIGRRSVI